MSRKVLIGSVLFALATGCANMSRPACMATAGLIGAVPGAVGGGVGTHNLEECHTPSGQTAAGAAAGAIAGGLIGLAVGYFVCPVVEPPPPPAPPEPPPAPLTQRRGG